MRYKEKINEFEFCPNQSENLKIYQQKSNKSISYVIIIDAKLFSNDGFFME